MSMLYWHWLVIGLGLLVTEMLLPTGFVLLFVSTAALLTGAVTWLFSPSLQAQLLIFSTLVLAGFFAWRRLRPAQAQNPQPTLNRRSESYVGRVFTLDTPIVNGVGKLRVDDSQWRVAGPDLPAGSQVRVVRAEGATLRVEPT